MNLKLDLNTVEFRTAAQRAVKELGANADALIKEEARFAIRDFVKVTPPFAAGAYNKSMGSAADRKAGEGAIKKDMAQVASPGPEGFLKHVAATYGTDNVKQTMFKKGTKKSYSIDWQKIIFTISELASAHLKKRNRYGRTGRVADKSTATEWVARGKVVVPSNVYAAYLKRLVVLVGREKNAFGVAAARLGLRLPTWVRKQGLSTAGRYMEGKGPSFFIEISGRSQRPQGPSDLAHVIKKRGEILTKEVQRMATSLAKTGKVLTRRKSFNVSE